MWLGFAFITGLTFVSYFYGMRDLIADAIEFSVPQVAVFWVGLFTLATYINAGWMREQVCMYMCPYARFQSSMFDRDTLIVSYDEARGDPRGSRKRGDEPSDHGRGDCIDCNMCVQVCPTGIDIRDGLQYECINCALCVDACDSVMDKMGYEPGLVKYTTENQLAGEPWTWKRPKLIGYGVAMVLMLTAMTVVLVNRVPLEVDVLRARGTLYQEVPGGLIQNIYTVKLLNMDKVDRRYTISVEGMPEHTLEPVVTGVSVDAGKVGEWSVNVIVNPDLLTEVNTAIRFMVQSEDGELNASSKSTFIGPRAI